MFLKVNPDTGKRVLRRGLIIGGTAVILVMLSIICVFAAVKQVTIVEEGKDPITISTFRQTAGDILKEQQIPLNYGDVVVPGETETVVGGGTIEISRAKKITLALDGNEYEIYTVKDTVGEVIADEGVVYDENDRWNVEPETKIADGMWIQLQRFSYEVIEETESVPFETEKQETTALAEGETKVVTEGKEGVKVNQYGLGKYDGVEETRELLSSEIVEQPVNRVVQIGAKRMVLTSRGSEIGRYRAVYTMSATGYDLSYESCGKRPGEKGYGVTATGMQARYGVVAVDPSVIPLGSRLYIETTDGSFVYGTAIAGDTGGSIKGNRIDLFFNSRSEALNFGRRTCKVYVLD